MPQRTPLGLPADTTPRAWYKFANTARPANGPSSADVYVYDAIGGWFGVGAQEFVNELKDLDVDEINLYVNSPGGDVYDAIAMTNALRRHRAKVTATIDGLAASAASFLITGADEIVMSPNSELMIHDASVYSWGNAGDLRETADQLDRISDNIASMYAARAGDTAADWRVLMLAETWFSAEEAVAQGLADRVASTDSGAEDRARMFDLSSFAHASRAESPEPLRTSAIADLRHKLPAADFEQRVAALVVERRGPRPDVPGTITDQKEVDRMADITKRFRDALGIPAEATLTDDELVAKLGEKITAPAPAAAAGTVTIDAEALALLQANSEAGVQALAAQTTARRASIVDQAVREGKVPPSRREHWSALLEADEEGTTGVLNSLPANTIPLTQISDVSDADAVSDEDTATWSAIYGAPAKSTTDTKE